jgi:actin-related protein
MPYRAVSTPTVRTRPICCVPLRDLMRNTPHNNVDAAETERVLQLSIQELVMRSILASPTELQYVNYILEEALKERVAAASTNHSTFSHRPELFGNIVFAGGSSALPGFGQRLQHEVSSALPRRQQRIGPAHHAYAHSWRSRIRLPRGVRRRLANEPAIRRVRYAR